MHYPRSRLLRLLFDGLKENQNKVMTSVSIHNIDMDDQGVRVQLEDGRVEHGSIIIGADGVHSQTRDISKFENLPPLAIYTGLV